MPLRFLGVDGSGSTSDAADAIRYAVDNGAKIINASWGGSGFSVCFEGCYRIRSQMGCFLWLPRVMMGER